MSFSTIDVQDDMSGHPMVSIIIPTLREAVNIPVLASEISSALKDVIPFWELIIVDDNSGDGTVEVCKRLRLQGIPLKLEVRKNERGLATAVLKGFAQARAPVFVVMDADLSHPPDTIPVFYQSIQEGADFAIGSRYMAGGGTDDKWTVYRYANSKIASLLAKPLVSVSDPMSGFFALPRSLLGQCERLTPIGYKIGLEIIVKCNPQKIVEIPIRFRTRLRGDSKLSIKQQFLYLRHVFSLYGAKRKRGGD